MKFKKIIYTYLLIALAINFVGCTQKNMLNQDSDDIRKIAWDQLSEESKKEIVGDWQDAKLEKVIANGKSINLLDLDYDNKEVYHVTFKTKNEELLGPIGVYISLDTHKIIGADYRE
ncbi:MAG: hypothetical protein PWP55_668 [Clostridiales bacterium]|jgi:hypothetical protein|nr:hypothetical protein [Clostridiales bacterium]